MEDLLGHTARLAGKKAKAKAGGAGAGAGAGRRGAMYRDFFGGQDGGEGEEEEEADGMDEDGGEGEEGSSGGEVLGFWGWVGPSSIGLPL